MNTNLATVTGAATVLLLAISSLVGACSSGGNREDEAIDTAAVRDSARDNQSSSRDSSRGHDDTNDTSKRRPDVTIDTLRVEGDEVLVRMRLLATDLYSTYYPDEEFIVEQSSSGEGTGIALVANFAGRRNDSALVHLFHAARPSDGPDHVRRLLLGSNGVIQSRGWSAATDSANRMPWALETYRISSSGALSGFASIGDHRGRGFMVIAVYPAEYGDGMGPRVARILEHWRWNDTGQPLLSEQPLIVPIPEPRR